MPIVQPILCISFQHSKVPQLKIATEIAWKLRELIRVYFNLLLLKLSETWVKFTALFVPSKYQTSLVPVIKWWSENQNEKSLLKVQNVRYLNGLQSQVTFTFEYRTPILSDEWIKCLFLLTKWLLLLWMRMNDMYSFVAIAILYQSMWVLNTRI